MKKKKQKEVSAYELFEEMIDKNHEFRTAHYEYKRKTYQFSIVLMGKLNNK